MPLDVLIEALLFFKSTPQNKEKIAKQFGVSIDDVIVALDVLRARLVGAIRLVETDTDIQLVTAPELSEFIASLRKQEVSGDIGKAGAETLAIVLYRGPVSRAEIDRIRGVNSSFILRNLMTRGLVIRESAGAGSYRFAVSPALLQQLGVSRKQELPRFSEFMNAIDTFETVHKHE
jgi:segregation and condensation protein B